MQDKIVKFLTELEQQSRYVMILLYYEKLNLMEISEVLQINAEEIIEISENTIDRFAQELGRAKV